MGKMKKNSEHIRKAFLTLTIAIFLCLGTQAEGKDGTGSPVFDTEPTRESLLAAMDHYGVLFPEIVLAQAILETGYFTSRVCKEQNNLFGLYDSRNRRYYTFPNWWDSVKAYKTMVQYRYQGGDYLEFLTRIGYATDNDYVTKIKKLTK